MSVDVDVIKSNEITRAFVLDEWELRSDGRTVDGRIIPYNEVAHVIDRDERGQLIEFDEQFLPGSCAAMVQACEARGNASFIAFNLDHEEMDLDHQIGHAVKLREMDDGAHATFRLYESRHLDKVRSMLAESHTGLSVKFKAVRTPRVMRNVISHVQVAIAHVAATPMPTYAGAGITRMRALEDTTQVFGTPLLDEVRAWLSDLGTPPVNV